MDELPRNHFGAILADPPWRFKTYNEKGRLKCPDWKHFKTSPALHYETMGFDELAAMPVCKSAADDCCLFLWISWPMLEDALSIIHAWGFEYKTCALRSADGDRLLDAR
jgi:N6-adenosine-specific RNA methylase IME4